MGLCILKTTLPYRGILKRLSPYRYKAYWVVQHHKELSYVWYGQTLGHFSHSEAPNWLSRYSIILKLNFKGGHFLSSTPRSTVATYVSETFTTRIHLTLSYLIVFLILVTSF